MPPFQELVEETMSSEVSQALQGTLLYFKI